MAASCLGGRHHLPFRVVAAVGQVPEDRAEGPQGTYYGRRQAHRADVHVGTGFGGQQAADVLDDDQGRADSRYRRGHVVPDAAAVAGLQALARSGQRDVCAREPARHDVNRRDVLPVHLTDVPEIRNTGIPGGEHLGRAGVVVRHPGELGAEPLADSGIESAVNSLSK